MNMGEISFPETTKHVIVKQNETDYFYFIVESQNQFSTGSEIVGIFESKEEAKLAFPDAQNFEEII